MFLETNIYDWPDSFNSLLFVRNLYPKMCYRSRVYKLPMLMQREEFRATDFSQIVGFLQKSVKMFLETNIYDWPHTFNSLLFVRHLCPKMCYRSRV
jgi:hypothetical protein